jgi:hypothetical protein
VKFWVWFVELSLLGIHIASQGFAENIHEIDAEDHLGEHTGEVRRYPNTDAKPHDNFRAVNRDFPGRPSSSGDAAKPKAKETMEIRITSLDGECPEAKTADGMVYSLGGVPEHLGALKVGDRFRITAVPTSRSFCMRGTTVLPIDVERLKD